MTPITVGVQLERDLIHEQAERRTDDAAEHIAWVARTLVEMGPGVATSMSTTQRVTPGEAETIRKLLPSLAAQHRLHARVDDEDGWLTVVFERRAP